MMDVGDLEPIEGYGTKEDEDGDREDITEGKEAVHSEAGIYGVGGGGNLDQKNSFRV